MTTAEQSVESNFVIGLHDAIGAGPEVMGTKAATLAHLASRGFRVPEGFVVTTAACDRILSAAGIPEEVWAEIRSHLDQLEEGPLAVRSSGTAEDLADASYAGQYETVLGVEGPEAVADAIGRCLASANSAQVRAYRGSDARARMAVLIQQMVPAEVAGVAFTANPISGDTDVLVSAVKGLGERLVSGQATPDEWVLRGNEVSCIRSSEGALGQDQARQVAELAKAVEHVFGTPQDIEWAMADGQNFVLQARPITALPVAPHLDVPSDGFWQKDTSHFPTPLTPFGASVLMEPLSNAMRPLVEQYGLMVDRVEQRSLGGEVYMRVIPFGGKDRAAPPVWAMWLAARLAPPLRRKARVAQAAIASGLAQRTLETWEGEWRPAFAREFRELRDVDLTILDDDDLLEHMDRAKDMLRRGMDLHFRLAMPYYLAFSELVAACEELLGWDVTRAVSLLTGASKASSEPGRELAALAERIAADPSAQQSITGAGMDPRTRLRQSAPWAVSALDEYLERYGHRTFDLDPGAPTWFERPEMVAALLADRVRHGRADVGDQRVQPEVLAQARAELAGRSEDDRGRFERVLTFARRAYGQREDNIFWLDNQPCALLRYAAVEIGRRLADRGVLAHAEQAVCLEEYELRSALASAGGADLRGLVARRKAERAWVTAHPGPAAYGKDPGPPPDLSALPDALRQVNAAAIQSTQLMFAPSQPQGASNELRGAPGSPGHYTGTVCVVRDESEFGKLNRGDVLVAPVTSPPWSVLFLQAGAVVTDGGGVLSHTAVIAREYGLPAVLNTGEATRRLRDGDLVSVDGTTGTVLFGPRAAGAIDPTSTATQVGRRAASTDLPAKA